MQQPHVWCFFNDWPDCFSPELLWMAASKSLWSKWTLMFVLFFWENITLKIYLIIFECVDKLSRKNISEENIGFGLADIWTTNSDCFTFYWTYLDWKSFGHWFIIKEFVLQLLDFTGFQLENTWITNLDFDCYMSYWIWLTGFNISQYPVSGTGEAFVLMVFTANDASWTLYPTNDAH